MRAVFLAVLSACCTACSTDTAGLAAEPEDTGPSGGNGPRASSAAGRSGAGEEGTEPDVVAMESPQTGVGRTRLSVFNGLHEADARLYVCPERSAAPWPAQGLVPFSGEEWPRELDIAESDFELHFFAALDSAQPESCRQLLRLPRQPACPTFDVRVAEDAGGFDAGASSAAGASGDAGASLPIHAVGGLAISATSLAAGWSHAAVVSGCADPCSLDAACATTSLFGSKAELTLVAFGGGGGSGTRLQALHAAPGIDRAEVSLVAADSSAAPLSLGGALSLGALRPRVAAVFPEDSGGLSSFAAVELRVVGEGDVWRWPLASLWQAAGLEGPPSSGEHLLILGGAGPVNEAPERVRLGWVAAPF